MREPFHQLYAHLIWATWDRLPLLYDARRDAIYKCILAECLAQNVDVIALGGVEDHVHLLVRYPPTLAISTLVKYVKGASSHLATHQMGSEGFFKWQGGNMAFTVAKSDLPRLEAYIMHQKEHHGDKTRWPEFELDALSNADDPN